jgi:hypothetical protein
LWWFTFFTNLPFRQHFILDQHKKLFSLIYGSALRENWNDWSLFTT